MSTLYIAEKAAAGKVLAAYLSKTSGIPARAFKTHVIVGTDTVAWVQGHVLEQVEPEAYDSAYADRSNFAQLPIIPLSFKLKVIKSASHLVTNIRDLLRDATSVVHFCDPDREGQLIGDELLQFIGNKKPVSRLWTVSLNDAGLARALSDVRDNAEYTGYSDAALARSHADWLYGINMSRAATISARNKGARSHFTVGRVQTPTLALVVHREDEINSFKSVEHFKPWIDLASVPGFRATWSPDESDPRFNPERLLTTRAAADAIVSVSGQVARVVSFSKDPGTLNPPLPFSLSALQAHCSKVLGFSPVKTLHVAEALYLRKIISYPRASSDHLPDSQHAEAPAVLSSLAKSPLPTSIGAALRGAKVSIKSKAWNDTELEKHGHHAVVPVQLDNPSVFTELNDDEKKLYLEVVKRYILQFWPAAQFLATTVVLESGNESFQASGRRYTSEGWRRAFAATKTAGDDEDEEAVKDATGPELPALEIDQVIKVSASGMEVLKTKPPKRFDEGTLLTAMKNVHQFVRDAAVKARLKINAGIGTEATRAETIKGLFDKEYIELSGREVVPTAKGTRLIGVLPLAMTSPDMTAMWESFLEAILAGKASYAAFMSKQQAWLKEMVSASPHFFDSVDFSNDPVPVGSLEIQETEHACNACGSSLRRINGKHGWFFGCSNAACKKTFLDRNGLPTERAPQAAVIDSGISCPVCKKHSLVRRERNDKTGHFWSCLGGKPDKKGCTAIFSDRDGLPDFDKKSATAKATPSKVSAVAGGSSAAGRVACTECAEGFLVRFARKAPKTGHFWSCSRWREGCKCSFNDLDGKPELVKGAGGKGAAGGAGPGAGPSRSAAPAPGPALVPSSNRFLAGLSGRGSFGGGGKGK